MGFEVFDRTEEKYQADIVRINKITLDIWVDSDHSAFLKLLSEAWSHADSSDKRILKSALEAILVKYSLEEEG